MSNRISSSHITELKDDEIFVFGSNLSGYHGAGAANVAYTKFDAKWGKGVGKMGRCYAIPTKDLYIQTLPLEYIATYVKRFIAYSKRFSDYKFLVTEIGCGLAGYKAKDIAPLFKDAIKLKNVYLPKSFIKYLIK